MKIAFPTERDLLLSFALFFFAKKKIGTKEKTTAYVCLLGSNVLPLSRCDSRFTLIPPKIYDIKP